MSGDSKHGSRQEKKGGKVMFETKLCSTTYHLQPYKICLGGNNTLLVLSCHVPVYTDITNVRQPDMVIVYKVTLCSNCEDKYCKYFLFTEHRVTVYQHILPTCLNLPLI